MKVRATANGFYDCYRVAGDVFDVPDGSEATWFEPVKTGKSKQSPPSDQGDPPDNAEQ